MRRRVGIGHGHHQEEAGVARVGGEPFLAVQHPLVAFQRGAGREGRRIGAALRFRHRETGDDVVGEQGLKIARLLLGRAVDGEDFRVAGIGRLAAEDGRGEHRASEDFVHQGQLDLPVAGAAQFGAQMAGPETAILHLLLQRADELLVQRIVDVERALQDQVERLDLLADEGVDPGQLVGEIGVGLEVPGHRPSPFVRSKIRTGFGRRRRRWSRRRCRRRAERPGTAPRRRFPRGGPADGGECP